MPLGKYADQMHFVSAPNDDFDASNWWLRHQGFELVGMEYIKLTAYLFVYGDAIWYVMAAALIAVSLVWWRHRRGTSEASTAGEPPELANET